ncbi:MAG: GH116 family glycosyl hydrolase [Chloroflexota bacterium]|nr:GH116 family glycosyl hydrolase [Chloroflexota bacterium]MDP6508120.1 GH116 family glycosyl hydrolase [Chloroflexota bacterium]MDP6757153.1 GH116 family glycosyl hydrolase [Chloroflexota bacterium]
MKLSLDYDIARWDDDCDGILSGSQWNTYDCGIFGHSSFTTSLYLTALRAIAATADLLDDPEPAAVARELFNKGSAGLDAELYNGEFYIQTVDHDRYDSMQYGDGCHSDQLPGQWWAHALGLGHVLPKDHVRTATNAIHRHNFRCDPLDHEQRPRVYARPEEPGVLLCTWPNGSEVDDSTNYAHETAWTGVEYAVAGQLIYEGHVNEALEIVSAVRSRQNGRIRNPWNEVECGDHYARTLASWNLLDALSGYLYDAGAAALAATPRVSADLYRAFFIGNRGWGSYWQETARGAHTAGLGIAHGEVQIAQLNLALSDGFAPETVAVSFAGSPLDANWEVTNGQLAVTLADTATIRAGEELVIIARS